MNNFNDDFDSANSRLAGLCKRALQGFILAGALIAAPAWAVHLIGHFELDGNTANDGVSVPGDDDWNDIFNGTDTALRSAFVVDSAVNDNTAFTGGVKDTQSLNQWTCTTTSPQNKSDILHGYAATYSEGGDLYLYAAGDREGNNGTANMAVWLFQGPVGCVSANGETPFFGTHLDGDLLLVAEFDQGGRVEGINIYRWSDPDGIPQNGDECLGGAAGDCSDEGLPAATGLNCNDAAPGDLSCGRTNPTAAIDAPWRAGIPSQAFFEIGVNLTQLIDDVGCFASAILETRSSTSLTATLKDFVSLDLSTCGTLEVVKETVGGNGTFGFGIDPSAGGPDAFDLAGGESRFFGTVEPDAYTITENALPAGPAAPDGWNLTGIECTGGTAGAPVFLNGGHDGGEITVDVDLSDDVVCTFTNTFTAPAGSITVTKVCDTVDAGGQTFDFALGGFPESCTDGTEVLACGDSVTCDGLSAGDYTVNETVPAGWELTAVDCVGADASTCGPAESPDATVTLGAGGAITVTFTDTENATIEVCKTTVPPGVGGDFAFSGDLGEFALADGECSETFEVTPDSPYDVTETVPAGFNLSDISCSGVNWSSSAPTVTVTPDPGEAVSCTFTNTENPGFIQICKDTVTTTDANPAFIVNLVGPDADLPQSAGLQDDECEFGQGDPGAVALTAGAGYSVSEDPAEGWDSTVACSGASGPENPNDINLASGEEVVCTFTNTQQGIIHVVKEATADGEFGFEISGPSLGDAFSIETSGGLGQETFEGLSTGFYDIDEVDSGTLVLVEEACDNGDNPDNLFLEPGAEVTCTFVNVLPVTVPVNRAWALAMLTLALLAAGWYFRPATRRRT